MVVKRQKKGDPKRILVVKLGALGDFILADSVFKSIRKHYPSAHITLLTTPAFEAFAKKLGYFDDVVAFERFSYFNLEKLLNFIGWVKSTHFDLVVDLQLVGRTRNYYYLFKIFAPQSFRWLGHVKASPYFLEDVYFKKHPSERFSKLLSKLDIPEPEPLDLTRLAASIDLPSTRFVFLVPSTSNAFNGAKTWPLENYKALIPHLIQMGYDVVIIGGPKEDHRALSVHERVFDMTGKTSFEQIFYLASKAAFAIGGDTGPMHMAASVGCPVFVMFSKIAPSAEQVGARGKKYHHLTAGDLKTLTVEEVLSPLKSFVQSL